MRIFILTFIFTLIIFSNSQCISVWDEYSDLKLSTDVMSYLYHRYESVEHVSISGFIYMNMSKSVSNISSEITLYTVHILEEESVLFNINMAKIYRTAYVNGYDGVIIASSQSKLTGEAMYFHYKDNTLYNVKRFEVREQFLLDVISEFPDGAYFDIIVSKDCDPYFNYWMNFYDSTLFHLIWISHIFFSLFVMICISYVLLVKWKNLMFVFRLCGFIYILSEILRVWDATFFIAQKQYRQGELVILFQISDVLGGITSYSMSLSALILWVSNFHLSLDVRVVDISESSRIVAIV